MDRIGQLFEVAKPRRDGDLVDRLNYAYTVSLLTAFSIIVGTWTYVGNPIQCWYPAYFKGWWKEYANDYCFVQNTYFLKFTEGPVHGHEMVQDARVEIPKNITTRDDREIAYYQWVAVVLALEAILVSLPAIIWRSINGHSSIPVNMILKTATNADCLDTDKRKSKMALVAKFLDHSRMVQANVAAGVRTHRFFSHYYVTSLYILMKLMYFLIGAMQFVIFNDFLGVEGHSYYGAGILSDLATGKEWHDTGKFPRVTLCDFEVRELANLHRHTVQCVLLINMFNEKIFVFLWWWFVIITIINGLSLIWWIFAVFYTSGNRGLIETYLEKPKDRTDQWFSHAIERFMKKHLNTDGLFVLKLVNSNSGDVVTGDLVRAMWNEFMTHEPKPNSPNAPPPPVTLAKGPAGALYPPPPPRYEEDDL